MDILSYVLAKSFAKKQAKTLQTQINALKSIGKYISNFNCTTGKFETEPAGYNVGDTYTFHTGDYVIVNAVNASGTNYILNGSTYVVGTSFSTTTAEHIEVNDYIFFDGSNWTILAHGVTQAIVGTSAPTTSTVGKLGQLYINTTTHDVYTCTTISGSTYTWEKLLHPTDYATTSAGGTLKVSSTYGTSMSSGYLVGLEKSAAQYDAMADAGFVSKGTLNNVIADRLEPKVIVKTALDSPLESGTIYDLTASSITSLPLVLPTSGVTAADIIIVKFTAGSAFTPTATGTIVDETLKAVTSGKTYTYCFMGHNATSWELNSRYA